LVGAKFVVRTDHNSLKYFLDQKDLNERQQKWVSKVQAYDFNIEFVKGKNIVVADVLSRRPSVYAMTDISVDWKAHLLVEYSKNKFACELMDGQVQDNFRIVDDIIYHKGRIFLVPESTFKTRVLQACHDSPVAGHQGFVKTYKQIRERFAWKGMKEDVMHHIKECTTCQVNKDEHTHPAGSLQPLPTPEHKWEFGKYIHGFHHGIAQGPGQGLHFCGGGQVNKVCSLFRHCHRLQCSTGCKFVL
jgi:hypothetical protein